MRMGLYVPADPQKPGVALHEFRVLLLPVALELLTRDPSRRRTMNTSLTIRTLLRARKPSSSAPTGLTPVSPIPPNGVRLA